MNKGGVNLGRLRLSLLFAVLVFILLLSITLAVTLGSVEMEAATVWKIALSQILLLGDGFQEEWSRSQQTIVWEIRFPRVLLGAIAGAGLSIVGVAMQALVRNSLADPYILGVSSGASVGATLVIVFGAFASLGQFALSIGAFSGALAAILLVFFLSRWGGRHSTIRLLMAGIAISAVLSALTQLLLFSAPDEQGIRSALFWMSGSLAGAKWDALPIPAAILLLAYAVLAAQYRSLNAMLMGEEAARTLGVNTARFHRQLFFIAALLTGVLVAVTGAIGFVGLMLPHIVRVLVGSDHRRVLPVSALMGAIFLIWADVIARLAFAPEEMPIGIITALCGGPFFLWLMLRSSYSFGGSGR